MEIDEARCKKCGACLQLGCPAIQGGEGIPEINAMLCSGCGLCGQVCKFDSVATVENVRP
jgi:indolepyruvate ferredoxin oxidoreductase alpha subunit